MTTYFCFIESSLLSIPHMEPLVSNNIADAREEARELMALHTSATAAHVFHGDQRVTTLTPEPPEVFISHGLPSKQDA